MNAVTFAAQITGPVSLDVADMDYDGDLDVVVGGSWMQNAVHVVVRARSSHVGVLGPLFGGR